MSTTPSPENLPQSDHLRDDVNLSDEPGEEGAAEFSEDEYTSTELNAGQRVPGLSPQGEYRQGFDPEQQDFDGAGPEES